MIENQVMHAVIKTGGKQYRVTKGQVLKVEKLEVPIGEAINFDQVLMLSDGSSVQIGQPYVKGAKVVAEVVGQGRGKKIEIIKFKRRKHHLKRQGHRQYYTQIKITDIVTN